MTLQNIYFYETGPALPGAFDSLFGGLYLVKGMPLLGQLGTLTAFALALAAAVQSLHRPRPWKRISLFASVFVFTGVWFFLLQPWDEVFINLRHSLHLAETGRFSFNRFEWLEGTVDFLPYFCLGLIAKTGLPLLDAAFILSYLGGLSCLVVGLRLFRVAKCPRAEPFFFLALAVFPPLLYNAATGFAATVFCAAVMACAYFLFFAQRTTTGLILAALLPLLRVEASLLVALFFCLWFAFTNVRSSTKILVGLALPFPAILHALIRWKLFGHAIPLPVQFKSSLGSLFFFAVGLRNFLADVIATHTLALFLALLLLRGVWKRNALKDSEEKRFGMVLCALFAFIFPYYLSGGDWFPSYWARYLLPLSVFLFVATAASLARLLTKLPPAEVAKALWVPLLFLVVSSLWPISSTWKLFDHVFSHRRTLAMIHEPTIARGHYRIQHLSQLGEHLRRTTLPSDRIGSSELATVMFFSKREGVDFLGLINPEIARSPLREMPSLLRKFPYRSELPYLIFKRLRPDMLAKTQPEILYTFDFMVRDQLKEVRPYELDNLSLFKALARWEKQLSGLMDPLYGGLRNIQRLGYEPVVVRAGEDFLALYFVHSSILPRHLAALARAGYKGGRITSTRPDGPFALAPAEQSRRQ